MIRILLILLTITGFLAPEIKKPDEFTSIEKKFTLHWKTKVGRACFRSNVVARGDQLIFASNGDRFMDIHLYDKASGIYMLNRKNGEISKKIGDGYIGDMDVNGVLLYNDKIYYGNDNEEFICSSTNGDIIWRNPASGDIEHEPILIVANGKKMIVYASESGEVCAVNPETGKKVWSYFTSDFNGWKPGDNRSIFKVKSYFSNSQSFYTKPEVADLNNDGVEDLIYNTYDRKIIALNGKTGVLLWKRDLPKRLYDYDITNVGNKNNPVLAVKEVSWDSTDVYKRSILYLGKKGEIIHEITINQDGYSFGLNSLHTPEGKTVFSLTDSILITDLQGKKDIFSRVRNYRTVNYRDDSVTETRNDRMALFAQAVFKYKGHSNCILLLNQRDGAYFEKGFVEIISLDSKEIIETLQLPSGSELAPVIADINMDGSLDLLISGYDNYLYCYNLGIKNSDLKFTSFKKQ